jgi:hypothetical protein
MDSLSRRLDKNFRRGLTEGFFVLEDSEAGIHI